MKNQNEKLKTAYKDVTIEDLKECMGFENLPDELAKKIAEAIRIYTEIIYNCFIEKRFEEQKSKTIFMNREEKNKAA